MKKLFPLAALSFFFACTSSVKESPKMQGAYFMTSQTIDYGSKQNKYTDLKQLKIYTDSFMMYAQVNPLDSVSGFGVGTYTTSPGQITENDIYRGHDSILDATPTTYTLNIQKTPDGYTQVIPEIMIDSQKTKLIEEYQSVGKAQQTPLDGVWKQTSDYSVNGKDTVKNNQVTTQYKAFYDGYFAWGQTTKDSTGKIHTGIGFGTFNWVNDKEIKETDLNSTFAIVAGQSFDVAINMSDGDNYTQVITYPDGSKSVEAYIRVKK